MRRSGDKTISTCFTSPPMGTTWAIPGKPRSRRRTTHSAVSRSSAPVTSSPPVSPTNMISPMIEDAGARIGSTFVGSAARTLVSFSATTCRATRGSVSHSNSTQMSEMPMADEERMRRSPLAPLSACSSGMVTSFSTSSGASPFASVTTVTDGADSSGSTSSGMRRASNRPKPTSTSAAATTSQGLRSDRRMMVSNTPSPVSAGATRWCPSSSPGGCRSRRG
jgi:hypothetical protein